MRPLTLLFAPLLISAICNAANLPVTTHTVTPRPERTPSAPPPTTPFQELPAPPIDRNPALQPGAAVPRGAAPASRDAGSLPILTGSKPDQPVQMLHFWMSQWMTNCYVLISRNREAVVIDPADWMEPLPDDHWSLTGKHSLQLVKALRARHLDVRFAICTHGHLDHVSGLTALKTAYPQCVICMAPGDIDAEGRPKDAHMFPGGLPRVDHALRNGELIQCGGVRLKVIFTPGHSPGSLSLLCGDWVFTGDTLFAGSVGRTNFRDGSGNWVQELASIRDQLYQLPPATLVLPGHFDFTTIGAEMGQNPFTLPAGKTP